MPDVLITQNLTTTDQNVTIGCEDNPLVGLEVSGTWSGTLNVESSENPAAPVWAAAQVFTSAGASAASTMTGNGRRLVNAVGMGQIRVRFNPATSGTAVVTLRAGDGSLGASGGGGGGGAVTVADGADVAQGTTTDTGIITDVAGTAIGFLRGLVKQSITLLARLPAALVSGRFDVNLGAAPATVTTQGDVASGTGDSGNPVKQGAVAVAHGADPTSVTAGQRTNKYSNRHGIGFVIGGHPNTKTVCHNFTAAQTDVALVTIATGNKIVVTSVLVKCHTTNTVNVSARVGFGTANVPAYGNAGLLLTDPGIAPGSGTGRGNGSGIIGVGADDEDLRFTCSVPTGGSVDLMYSYHTVPS